MKIQYEKLLNTKPFSKKINKLYMVPLSFPINSRMLTFAQKKMNYSKI